jgi:hypothetical protein
LLPSQADECGDKEELRAELATTNAQLATVSKDEAAARAAAAALKSYLEDSQAACDVVRAGEARAQERVAALSADKQQLVRAHVRTHALLPPRRVDACFAKAVRAAARGCCATPSSCVCIIRRLRASPLLASTHRPRRLAGGNDRSAQRSAG